MHNVSVLMVSFFWFEVFCKSYFWMLKRHTYLYENFWSKLTFLKFCPCGDLKSNIYYLASGLILTSHDIVTTWLNCFSLFHVCQTCCEVTLMSLCGKNVKWLIDLLRCTPDWMKYMLWKLSTFIWRLLWSYEFLRKIL